MSGRFFDLLLVPVGKRVFPIRIVSGEPVDALLSLWCFRFAEVSLSCLEYCTNSAVLTEDILLPTHGLSYVQKGSEFRVSLLYRKTGKDTSAWVSAVFVSTVNTSSTKPVGQIWSVLCVAESWVLHICPTFGSPDKITWQFLTISGRGHVGELPYNETALLGKRAMLLIDELWDDEQWRCEFERHGSLLCTICCQHLIALGRFTQGWQARREEIKPKTLSISGECFGLTVWDSCLEPYPADVLNCLIAAGNIRRH